VSAEITQVLALAEPHDGDHYVVPARSGMVFFSEPEPAG
jgi:hypothetical protein